MMPSSLRKPEGSRERRTTNTPVLSNRRTVCRPDHERDKLCNPRSGTDADVVRLAVDDRLRRGVAGAARDPAFPVRPSEIWERIRIFVFFSIPSSFRVKQPDGVGSGALT